MKLYS